VSTPDASPLPAGTAICVTSAGDVQPVCSADGAASWTFPVVAGEIEYTVLAPGYDLVFGYDEVPAGEERVIDVVLEPAVGSGMNITKTVSDPNPLPGTEVEYEIHVWGTTPSMEEINFVDVLPAELSDVRVECELIEGFPISPSCAYPVDGYIVGTIVPDDYNDDSDVYEMVVTVTGTVTSEPNVEFTNLACVSTSPARPAVSGERTGILAFAQPMMPVGACAAATVLTQNLPVPGAWGDATKTVDVEEAQPGDAVTYTVTLPWTAGDEGAVGEATFSLADSVPDRVTDIAWTCGGENVTCDVASGSESYVTVTGSVDDPEADALVVLTITGVVAANAHAGQVVNQACSNSEVMPPDQVIPVLSFAAQQPGCQSMPAAVFYVVLDPGTPTPTPTPSPTDPAPDVTPTATATASATATPANDARPTVTTLPNTGATPVDSDLPLGPAALVAAMLFAAGAVVTRGARAKR
jgi:hypothetical protein